MSVNDTTDELARVHRRRQDVIKKRVLSSSYAMQCIRKSTTMGAAVTVRVLSHCFSGGSPEKRPWRKQRPAIVNDECNDVQNCHKWTDEEEVVVRCNASEDG